MKRILALLISFSIITTQCMDVGSSSQEISNGSNFLMMSSDNNPVTFTDNHYNECNVLKDCIHQSQEQTKDQIPTVPFTEKTLTDFQELLNLVISKEDTKVHEKLQNLSQKNFIKLFKAINYLDCEILKPIMITLLVQNNSYAQRLLKSKMMDPVGNTEVKSRLLEDQTFLTTLQKHIKPTAKYIERNPILKLSFDGISYPLYTNNHDGYEIIDLKSGKKIDTLYLEKNGLTKICYFNNKYYVAFRDKSIRIGRVNSPESEGGFIAHSRSKINSIDLANDQFIAGSDDGTLQIIDMRKKEKIEIKKKHQSSICLTRYSVDGAYFASVSKDGVIKLWSNKDKKCIKSFKGAPYNHATLGKIISFSPANQLAYIAKNNSIHVVTIDNLHDEIISLENSSPTPDENLKVYSLCYSPDGNYLAYHVEGNGIGIFDSQSKKTIFKTNYFAQEDKIHHISFNAEGSHIVVFNEKDDGFFTVCHYPLLHILVKQLDVSQVLLLGHIKYSYETTGKAVILSEECSAQLPKWMRNDLESADLLETPSLMQKIYSGFKGKTNALWSFISS